MLSVRDATLREDLGGTYGVSVNPNYTHIPVEEYLRLQKRYAHLFGEHPRPDIVARIQAGADRNIERFGLLSDEEPAGPGAAQDIAGEGAV